MTGRPTALVTGAGSGIGAATAGPPWRRAIVNETP